MKLLVFPTDCEVDGGLFDFLRCADIPTVGASSTRGQRFLGNEVYWLPYITEPGFFGELRRLIEEEEITHIYTSHAGVWGKLENFIADVSPLRTLKLCSEFPFDVEWKKHRKYDDWGRDIYRECKSIGVGNLLNEEQLTALYKQYHAIPGQSDDHKLAALVRLAPQVPEGDWVEIGSLYGRSSFALGVLAALYGPSALVCIDPWDADNIPDQEGKAAILDQQAKLIDYKQVFQIFKSSIALLPNVTYIKGLSEKAINRYLAPDFDGRNLDIKKEIAFLHIDGSHHFDEVTKDIALWEPHVRIGGWIAIDDYLWAFGDGPKRAGDNLLNTGRFDTAFVSGDTLYLRKNARE